LTYRNLGVRIATDKLTWLASLPEVVNVEPRPQYQKLDEVQGQIMAGNLNAAGTQPTGPLLGLADQPRISADRRVLSHRGCD